MSIFRSIVFTAAAAGLCVGLAVTAVQQISAVPLILKAEVYEKQAETTKPIEEPATSADKHNGKHDHAAATWAPADGLERNAYTALFNVVQWTGFSLCLAGLLVIANRPVTWREGLFWGLGGFVAVVLAPSLGLPPEPPGVPAADFILRQAWWLATVLATAIGIGLMALTRSILLSVIGGLLIVAPHIVGAPHLIEVTTNVPAALSRQFGVAVLVTTFLSWTLIGALTGFFLARFGRSEAQ
ncbi:MAG: CbtA family protein [bacterium]|jgi:cobalt transporter subunit CbtA